MSGNFHRQDQFVVEYLKCLNASEAARLACAIEKDQTAAVAGLRYMRHPPVREAINKALAERNAALKLDANQILHEVHSMVMMDIADIINENGSLMEVHEMPVEARRAIASFEVEELWSGPPNARVQIGVLKKVKMWSKDKNTELLLRHLGLLNDKLDVKVTDALSERIRNARKRSGI